MAPKPDAHRIVRAVRIAAFLTRDPIGEARTVILMHIAAKATRNTLTWSGSRRGDWSALSKRSPENRGEKVSAPVRQLPSAAEDEWSTATKPCTPRNVAVLILVTLSSIAIAWLVVAL